MTRSLGHRILSLRVGAVALLAGLSLAVSGCFISPGKFTSELALNGGEEFTFTYDGEIFFLGLSKLAQMGAGSQATFTPSECYDDETYQSRECTKAELDEQRREWDEGAADRARQAKQQSEQMAAIMGGIDPSDPKAAEELIKILLRQRGWEQAESLGDGLFKVRYRLSGTLAHDFMFPVIEGFPATNPFVQTFARKNGQVRINAPGFAAQGADSMMGGMMGGMGAMAGMGSMGTNSGNPDEMSALPQLEGTFTIRTTGKMTIRANNTDNGPEATANGEVLTWRISARTAQAPTALIDLTR